MSTFPVDTYRQDFPILAQRTPQGKPLVFLDNAASTQKPQAVIKAITELYTGYYSNVGRASYWPATQASKAYEAARAAVAGFIGAADVREVVFTAGTTDGINKVMQAYLRPRLQAGDNVVISEQEHHANLIPWQQACHAAQAQLRVIPLLPSGDLDLAALPGLLDERTRLVALTAVSNTLGVVNSVAAVVQQAHARGIRVLVDAAQHVGHSPTRVQEWGADWVAFSGHKMYGPTGIGVLYGTAEVLREMAPMAYGGGAIRNVSFADTQFADIPHRHEPGTPNLAGAVGLMAAVHYLEGIGMEAIQHHTHHLTTYALAKIATLEGVSVLANPEHRAPVLSVQVASTHPHDVAAYLAEEGIAIRAGHHCTKPLMETLGMHGTARVSMGLYTTEEEIDLLVEVLKEVQDFFH